MAREFISDYAVTISRDRIVVPELAEKSAFFSRDLVPHVPPHDMVVPNAFTHVSRELWQTGERGDYVLCAAKGRRQGEDPHCSFKYNFAEGSISDHTSYYGTTEPVADPCSGGAGPCIADGACTELHLNGRPPVINEDQDRNPITTFEAEVKQQAKAMVDSGKVKASVEMVGDH